MPAAERESGWRGAMRVRKQKRRGEGGEKSREETSRERQRKANWEGADRERENREQARH